jgi:hypothetical protein
MPSAGLIEDIYGYVRGADSAAADSVHSQPPWLFSSALGRDDAAALLASHGEELGTFLVRQKGKDSFAISMRIATGFEHHLLRRNDDGNFVVNKTPLEDASTLEQAVSILSGEIGATLLTTSLQAAVCIPHKSSSTGTPAWVHGSLKKETVEEMLLGVGGGASGLFMVYDCKGSRTLAVVDDSGGVQHKLVTQSEGGGEDDLDTCTDGIFRIDGQVVVEASVYGGDGDGDVFSVPTQATDWTSLRTILSSPNEYLQTPLVKGVCRSVTPPELLSADGTRPAWLYGAISRAGAEALLDGHEPGAFIVRDSAESDREFKLSHKKIAGGVAHQKLVAVQPGCWTISDHPVDYANTLQDLAEVMRDQSKSGLKFVLTYGVENAPEYIVVPCSEDQIYAVQPTTDDNNATFMDDLVVTANKASVGSENAHIYSTASGEVSSQYICVSNSSEASGIYNVATNGAVNDSNYFTVGANGEGAYGSVAPSDHYFTVSASDTGYIASDQVQVAGGSDSNIYSVPTASDQVQVAGGSDSNIYSVPTAGAPLVHPTSAYGAGDNHHVYGGDGDVYSVPAEDTSAYADPNAGHSRPRLNSVDLFPMVDDPEATAKAKRPAARRPVTMFENPDQPVVGRQKTLRENPDQPAAGRQKTLREESPYQPAAGRQPTLRENPDQPAAGRRPTLRTDENIQEYDNSDHANVSVASGNTMYAVPTDMGQPARHRTVTRQSSYSQAIGNDHVAQVGGTLYAVPTEALPEDDAVYAIPNEEGGVASRERSYGAAINGSYTEGRTVAHNSTYKTITPENTLTLGRGSSLQTEIDVDAGATFTLGRGSSLAESSDDTQDELSIGGKAHAETML